VSGRPIASRVIAGVGIVLAVLFTGLMISTGEIGTVPVSVLAVELGLGLLLPSTLVGAGVWLARSDLPGERTWEVTLWTLGGLGTFTVLTGWQFYFQLLLTGGRQPSLATLVINGQAGAISGFLVGAYNARANQRATELADARERLQFLNRLLRHDILNAVQVIAGLTKAYADSGAIDEEDADRLLSKCHEITDLIERVRTIEQATDREDLSEYDLSAELRTVVDRTRSAHDDVRLDDDVESDLRVWADELLSTTLDNVLTNAVEHGTGDDGSAVRITTSAERRDDVVRIEIADDGPGISDDRKESVFDLQQRDGHGVGLYLVQTLVDAYDGEVWVDDNDPTGAVFVIELPNAATRR